MRHIDQVVVDFDDVLERRADSFERGLDILEALDRLGAEIPGAPANLPSAVMPSCPDR
jgi:hypothetical protein